MSVLRLAAMLAFFLPGTLAAASTIQQISLDLSFSGDTYFDVQVESGSVVDGAWVSDAVLFSGPSLQQGDDLWGLPRLFAFAPGQSLAFRARILQPDVGSGDAPSLLSCALGGYDCNGATQVETTGNGFDFFYGSEIWLRGGLAQGDAITFDFFPGARLYALTTSGDLASWNVWRSDFVVLGDLPPVAPVPLPASALLLVMGLSGLGLLRRQCRRG